MKIGRKFALMLAALAGSAASSVAMGEGFKALQFTKDNGKTYTILPNNLEFCFNEDLITFNNIDLHLPVTSVVSMEFTDNYVDPSGVEQIAVNTSGKIEVFTMEGKAIGGFDSYSDAINSLTNGIYVIKDSKGNSLKIKVGK